MPKTAIDPFFGIAQDLVAPARYGASVIPSDSTDLAYVTKALIVTIGSGGTGITVLFPNDPDSNPVTIPLAQGSYTLDVQVRRVMNTGTSLGGGGIVALWGG